MAANKLIGIVIDKKDYENYDQLVTFLCPKFRQKITFLAKGVRKTNSKNGANLQLFSIVELEIFLARDTLKISRLKRAILLKQYDFLNPFVQTTLEKIRMIFKNTQSISNSFLKLYSLVLEKIKGEECNWWISILLANCPLMDAIKPYSSKCSECGVINRLIQFCWHNGGMKCRSHASQITSYSMLLNYYFLFNNFDKYIKNCDIYQNDFIQKEIINFLHENGYF